MKFLDKLKLSSSENITNLDDPGTTELHKEIIQSKPFLKNLYIEFYHQFLDSLPQLGGGLKVIELGSGGGFIKEVIPEAITSEILDIDSVDLRFSALDLPFKDNCLDAIVMFDVFHHIPDVSQFLKEALRGLKPAGRIVMIEPANTIFGRFIYQNFHHEPFNPKAAWTFESAGPLSSANGALPWIVFQRDRPRFLKEFPGFSITKIRYHTALTYLLSGGLSYKQFVPTFCYRGVKIIELLLTPVNRFVGMFMTIELAKKD